jgi:putative tricarboxylic transport membrane protein
MPLLIGMAMIIFGSIGFFHATVQSFKGVSWIPVLKGKRWPRVATALLLLLGYALVLKPLGFILTTVFLVGFLLRFLEGQRWPTVISVAVVSALFAYAVFEIWLEAQLPTGFLGI